APWPGVMVVVKGPVGTQAEYTGVDGTARFPGLYPGDGYTATFTLDGFKTVIREGLSIGAGRTVAFDLEMELSAIEETITVTGESPVVDVRSTNIAGLITSDLLDRTPTASGLWAGVLDHVPGVMSSLDVGGGDSGQQTSPRAWGSETRNNSYNVNGGDTTDPAAVGASSSYFSVASFEEINVSLAAQDIEIKTPGINMNMVVKSGSNDWHGGVKYFYEGSDLVSNNVDQNLMDQGITEGTPIELLVDMDFQGGGPIWRDRAWFFVDYWDFEIEKVVLGLEEADGTDLRDWTLNFNAQIDQNNKISGRYIDTKKFRNNRGASRSRPYLGRIQDSSTKIPQLQWQSVINQNVFTDIRFSTVRSNFPLVRRNPDSQVPDAPHINQSATWDFSIGNYVLRPSNPTSEFFDERDTDSLNGTASWYVTGENTSHDIKFGGNFQNIDYFAPFNYPNGYRRFVRSSRVGDPVFDPDNNPAWADGVPVEIRLYNAPIASADGGAQDCFVLGSCWSPDNAFTQKGRTYGLFAQDTVTIANKVTIIAGVRFDRSLNWNPAQNRLDSPWCAGASTLRNPEFFCGGSFAEQEPAFFWNNLTPRIGLIYDIAGDGRWAAKFNYSRYAEQLGISVGGATNVNDVAREDWNWFDPNGDGIFQFGEQTTFRSQSLPGAGNRIDPELTSPMTNEFTFGVDHELFDNILVSVTGIIRGRTNDVGTVNIGRPFGLMLTNDRCIAECTPTFSDGSPRPLEDPWVPTQQVDPGADGIFGTADDGGSITVWALDPNTFGTSVNLTTNSNSWGFEDDIDFKGVSFVMSKRWSNNWQILTSYDYGKGYNTEESTTPNGLFNGRRAELFGSRPHNFKLTGNYLFAEPIGVNLGIFIRAQSGEPVQARFTYSRTILEAGSGFGGQGNTAITIDARGEGNNGRPTREDFVTIVDFRAEKQVTIGQYGVVHFYFDVFNLFNANTITEFDWNLGRFYGEIQDILPPRVIRVGGAWDF
ncbi:MAG: TonB-dependent receptor, partial [Acidobacteria bacterium]|nr:TonB-dependent receptor [Acidobacteriota bacterium]